MAQPRPSTFSIVAFDPRTKDLGVAVESRFVAVGSVVPWAQAGVGAVATQSYANTAYGPRGLALLKRGLHPKDVIQRLTKNDAMAAQRQVGVIDARGRAASFTGDDCFEWAGHVVGRNYACQGNILAGEAVVKGMARAFESTEGDLPVRLLAALHAGQKAGGDKRGQQSAALVVVRPKGGYGGLNDRWIDVRVDDHPVPIEELTRVFNIYDVTLLNRENPADVVPLTPSLVRELQRGLTRLGFYHGPLSGKYDRPTKAAFEAWASINNFENKLPRSGKMWGSIHRVFVSQVNAPRE
ncbi:MAG TPA: DUF1028 domain-containing protein [Thermoplasmata archaeon]|nr:DUF1028 domain-containing protein [Thermoplasmata archaeon]